VFLERMTFRTADRVTSTNESYAEIARRRGGKERTEVTVVRTGPDPEKLKSGSVDESLRKGRRHLVAYLGVMGPQDGVDLAVRAAGSVVHDLGRRDVSFVFMGSGDCHQDLGALRDELGLQDYLEPPGRVPDEFVHRVLSTADVGHSPDPMNPLNDVATMNKTMEYMAYGVPCGAVDLHETRVSAGPAAAYVEPNSIAEFARTVVDLLDQPDVRSKMGRLARERVVNELAWEHQESGYVQVFDDLTHALSERGR
jgi:glycosyltransferase involved in cell wall biosynthesis